MEGRIMAGRYNTWLRTKLADRVRSNGGYSSRSDGGPLAWTVHYFSSAALEDVQKVLDMLAEDYFSSMADMLLQYPTIDTDLATLLGSSERTRWEYAQERLADDLHDDEGLSMWSPATTARYGFDYKGEGAERGFDMELKNYGRGGKHVCLTRFDYESLDRFTNDELAELIDPAIEKDYNYDAMLSNGWCRKLMGIMDELDKQLTDEAATECGMYYEVDWLARELGLFD
jgi:hypothetical protein